MTVASFTWRAPWPFPFPTPAPHRVNGLLPALAGSKVIRGGYAREFGAVQPIVDSAHAEPVAPLPYRGAHTEKCQTRTGSKDDPASLS